MLPLAVDDDVPAPNALDELTRFTEAPDVLMGPSPVDEREGVA
jgi:hypothetical protein